MLRAHTVWPGPWRVSKAACRGGVGQDTDINLREEAEDGEFAKLLSAYKASLHLTQNVNFL